uniref:DAZ interacting zinc finger protein 1 n=1 Tax=Cyclopterus lumpus TaxID=8103 RepID=A0A8C3A686_CYCLU
HSSAGIPSLLNSPLSQHPVSSMTPSSGASAIIPFKFRPRRESVDWRRINAVDVDLVVSQLDLDALQEHISGVTFCSLDSERCQRCQSPVDPALVKLLRLAQLTVEWLLHCQEFLTHSMRAMEERVAAAGREREQLLAQQKKLEEKVKMLTAELKQRKKVIRTQQSMLAPRIVSGQKCPHCDKSFLNSSFLQNHMQRRHPGEYDTGRWSCQKSYRMQSSVSDHQENSQRLQQEMDRRLQEREHTIRAQREQVSGDSHSHIVSGEEARLIQDILYLLSVLRHDDTVCLTGSGLILQSSRLVVPRVTLLCVSCPVLQIRPRSSSLPSRAIRVVSGPAVKQPKTPQPIPRARTTAKPKTSTPKTAPRTFTSKTPPFSSGEESDEVDTDIEEERHHQKHQRGKSPQPRLNQVQIGAGKASPVQSRLAQARQSFASNPQQARGSAARTAVAKMESDDDEWSELSELQEIDPKRLQNFKDQNGNILYNVLLMSILLENKINDLVRKMEKQVAERVVKKPAGGVNSLHRQNLSYTDLGESSDWAVSSFEDRRETAQGSGPARKSLESPSTSVWGTSTGKGAKSGLTDAGTGSTLKSSLCSLSDISDSEDISNK